MLDTHKTNPTCPSCHKAANVRKHGKARSGLPRYFCNHCQKAFQNQYIYIAYQRQSADIPTR
ncbi:IS1/IS1595 family N-terminal zinc-binding domain-containing protein [Budvicia aquatica]|uniref:Transposase and inactivated derivatives n=1 Tax=Budvicia aquatica TaxID=82979 RepID=A0A2C6CZV9_9GAMM|nr:IS1 family transposase [Budvicia aquatica]PHI28837.1 hypothetical protein CRN84_05685 [Budvicia aquatica]PHI32229.1 hypothetical protein CRN84_24375 [Budvicia aquatica]VFS46942.1 Transposase and inactivated derivatives [Budvicia aquatica]